MQKEREIFSKKFFSQKFFFCRQKERLIKTLLLKNFWSKKERKRRTLSSRFVSLFSLSHSSLSHTHCLFTRAAFIIDTSSDEPSAWDNCTRDAKELRKKERAVRSSSSRKTEARAASERKRKVGRWFQGGPFCQSFLHIPRITGSESCFITVQEKSKRYMQNSMIFWSSSPTRAITHNC